MKRFSLTTVFCLFLAVCGRAQDENGNPNPRAAFQQWEYRLISLGSFQLELARKLGQTKKTEAGEVIDEMKAFAPLLKPDLAAKNRDATDKYTLEWFNALGAEGWQFSGCLGKDNETLVFRRPKA